MHTILSVKTFVSNVLYHFSLIAYKLFNMASSTIKNKTKNNLITVQHNDC